MRRVSAVIIFIILFFNAKAGHGSVQNITVTQPWLAVITAFIGGSNVSVTSMSDFSGAVIKNKNKNDNENNENEKKIISLDREDIKKYNIKNLRDAGTNMQSDGVNSEIWYLYTSFPFSADFNENNNYNENIEGSILDPSVTPFIAQKIMTALSTWDAGNYPYYQRRLAEFQTRLSSSILAGKQLLNGTKVHVNEESSALINLLRAAGCEIVNGKDDIKDNNNINIIIDDSVQKRGKSARRSAGRNADVFVFQRPVINDNNYNIDYPAFLHDQYIALWQFATRNRGVQGAK